MKNSFYTIIAIGTVFCGRLTAQDLTNKYGDTILPQAKDWGISIDATRFIKNADFNFSTQAQNLTVKYFVDAHTAYRFGARIGINDWTAKSMVIDRVLMTSSVIAYPAAYPMKQNTWKRTAGTFGLSAGIEKRRGRTRLQGVYGAEAGIYLSFVNDKFFYGNKLNADPLSPIVVDSTADAMTNPALGAANNVLLGPPIQGVVGNARMVQRSSGLAFTIGARAFMGVEYFLLPKISLGGEFGWGLGVTTSGRSETILESIGQGNTNPAPAVKRTTIDGGQFSTIRIDTDNANVIGGMSATLRLNLYF